MSAVTTPNQVQICTCGRALYPQHCLRCGSTQVYAKSVNDQVIGGVSYPGFKCRKCAYEFSTYVQCAAPTPVGKKDATVPVAINTAKAIKEAGGRQAYIAQLLQKNGVIKDAKAAIEALKDKAPKHPSHGENDEWRETNPLFVEDVERPGRD